MARIRTIKPDFWTDDKLTECSVSARLLFIGTWNFADDEGNLDRSAKQIKARVFPVDNIDCEPLLRELITQGLLTEYSVNDKTYLHIQGFRKHQVINRPSAPSCPMFEESLITHGVLSEPSVSTHAGREGKGREDIAPAKAAAFNPKTRLEGLGVGADLIADFLAIRKAKQKPLTETAVKGIIREAEKAGWSVEQAVKVCCERGWQSFQAKYVENEKPVETKPAPVFDHAAYVAQRKADADAAKERMRLEQAEFMRAKA